MKLRKIINQQNIIFSRLYSLCTVLFSSFALAFCAETPVFFGTTPRDFCVVEEVGGNSHTRETDNTHGGGQKTAVVE